MAYAVLLSLAQTIHQILNNDQYPISDDGRDQPTSLREHVISLREFLEKFPKEAVRLEPRIRDAANKAEDDLEHFMYDQIRKLEPPGFLELITTWIWFPNKSMTNIVYDIDRIKEAMEEIYSISREAAYLKSLRTAKAATTPGSSSAKAATTDDGPSIIREALTLEVRDLLCGESSKLLIIPIMGMGGIGKTTLARTIYEDKQIVESFTVRAWVTVSQDYNAENICSRILDFCRKVGDVRSGNTELDRVYRFLKGRKYLIVLDDIWSTNAWDAIKTAFPNDGNGSRILLTTRIMDVVSYTTNFSKYMGMSAMSLDESWNLLRQKVFRANEDCPSELKHIGKDIARSCGGLPLAVVLAAGLLSTSDQTPLSWSKVADRVRSSRQLEDIISLSYTHLPHHLRPCFLYMGCFPEDYEIRVSRLTKLWVAEGIVDGARPEEVAEKYLNDLVRRSLALVIERKFDGKIKSCNVHDMVRDICKRRAQEENYQRRLSIARPYPLSDVRSGKTLRSLICFETSRETFHKTLKTFVMKFPDLFMSLGSLRLLRVLDVSKFFLLLGLDQVCFLLHLRYLAISENWQPMGPLLMMKISRLQNLRTLIINVRGDYPNVIERIPVPVEILRMPHLTHLNLISHCPLEVYASKVTMEKLETLSMVTRFKCTKNFIRMIPNVKKLGIICFGKEDNQFHNLVLLHQLQKLKVVCSDKSPKLRYSDIIRPKVMVNPVFPNMLKKLTLSGWRLSGKCMEKVGCLPNLQVLILREFGCEGDKWEIKEKQFPSLKCLYIDGSDLKDWVNEDGHFPMLKYLLLFDCVALRQIPDGIGDITTLRLIEVGRTNQFLVRRFQQIQEQQEENGNNDLHVGYDKIGKWAYKRKRLASNAMRVS